MILNKETQDKMVFIYTTCRDKGEAKHLGYAAVEEKLAICADFWPIESIYPWQNVIQDVVQYMVIFTTKKSLSEKLSSFIAGLHSYTVPMVAECDTVFTNRAYAAWGNKVLENQENYISEQEARMIEISDQEDGYHPGRLK
ncbi:divalent-cation tolerance protein CutA [Candidatus Nomurabacteria bacterium]|nr:divalent-cation tolerance protein CutA [Candidatus Nomurabacteria bacterium]